MNNKNRKYTQEEDEAIFRAVKGSTTSLKTCFISVAKDLGRTPGGIENRWYTQLSNPNSKNYMGTAMLMIKAHRAGINRANVNTFPIESKPTLFKKILRLFKLW